MSEKKTKVDILSFSRTFNQCNTYKEVAEKLNRTYGAILNRSNKLRKIGINLKEMPKSSRQKQTIDVAKINEELAKYS